MTKKNVFGPLLAGLVLTMTSYFAHAEQERSMLNGNLLAAEVARAELVLNASGEVVQVKVDGCEQCELSGYLPSRRMTVTRAGKAVSRGQLRRFSGGPGTVVINLDTGMVNQVMYWDDSTTEAQ